MTLLPGTLCSCLWLKFVQQEDEILRSQGWEHCEHDKPAHRTLRHSNGMIWAQFGCSPMVATIHQRVKLEQGKHTMIRERHSHEIARAPKQVYLHPRWSGVGCTNWINKMVRSLVLLELLGSVHVHRFKTKTSVRICFRFALCKWKKHCVGCNFISLGDQPPDLHLEIKRGQLLRQAIFWNGFRRSPSSHNWGLWQRMFQECSQPPRLHQPFSGRPDPGFRPWRGCPCCRQQPRISRAVMGLKLRSWSHSMAASPGPPLSRGWERWGSRTAWPPKPKERREDSRIRLWKAVGNLVSPWRLSLSRGLFHPPDSVLSSRGYF